MGLYWVWRRLSRHIGIVGSGSSHILHGCEFSNYNKTELKITVCVYVSSEEKKCSIGMEETGKKDRAVSQCVCVRER